MTEPRDTAFDDLVRSETEPAEHLEGFTDRLGHGLHEVDKGLGRVTAPHRRRRVLVAAAVIALLAGLLVAMWLGGSTTEPTAAELTQMRASIQEWETASWLPWPPDYYSARTLPAEVHGEMTAQRLAVARKVGTDEFLESYEVQADMAGFLEEFRKGGEPLIVRTYQRVLDVTVDRIEMDGDVVLRVPVWLGEVTAVWDDTKGKLTRRHRLDTTPVYEFTMRSDNGTWRIVEKREVEMSEDASGPLFGPDTPHEQLPLLSPDD